MTVGDTDFTPQVAEGRRFPARFLPPGHEFEGAGWVVAGAGSVTFSIAPGGVVSKTFEFRIADLVSIEWLDGHHRLRVRDREGRTMIAWISPAEAPELRRLLPDRRPPEQDEPDEQGRLKEEEKLFQARLDEINPAPRATPLLILLNVVIFVIMASAGAGVFEANGEVHLWFGSNFGPRTWTGEPWRLLTSAFLHFGVLHLAFNMYALNNGGMLAERLFGTARFVVIYLLAALGGSVVSGWWEPLRNSAGASGAVFGVYGALLTFFAIRRRELPASFFKSAALGASILVCYSLLAGAASEGIDNACHVGGLLTGAVLGWLLGRPLEPAARRTAQPRKVVAAISGVCLGLVVLSSPLWAIGTRKHADLVFRRAVHEFSAIEARLVDVSQEIIRTHESGKLGNVQAAQRLQREVIEPWQEAAAPLLAVKLPRARESSGARRLQAFQEYLIARERALRLSMHMLEGMEPVDEAAVRRAWERVGQLIETIQDGETSPEGAGRSH